MPTPPKDPASASREQQASSPPPAAPLPGASRPGLGRRLRSIAVYSIGLGLLAFLVSRMPVESIFQALSEVGLSVLWVFALAIFFYLTLSLALSRLLCRQAPLGTVFYASLVGNAFNQILPLAGLGGEPYKIKLLSSRIPIERASQAVVVERLLHAAPGPLFGGLLLPLSLFLVPTSGAVSVPAALAAGVLLGIAALLLLVAFSRFPSRATARVLSKFSAFRTIQSERIPRPRIAAAFGWKLCGQLFHIFEIWVIFRILGYTPSPEQVIVVAAAVFASSALFFIFPQGIGVNEAGITGAFALLGLPVHIGLTFGLIRRSRLVLWALLGLSLHLGVGAARRIGFESSAARRPAPARAASGVTTAVEEPTL